MELALVTTQFNFGAALFLCVIMTAVHTNAGWSQPAARHRQMTMPTRMDDDKFLRLLKINEELMDVCDWLNERRDTSTASRLIPITGDLTRPIAKLSMERK
jgi:hypothetical protein